MRQLLSLLFAALLCCGMTAAQYQVILGGSASLTYYISNIGSDSNTGLSPGSPWLTVAKVNASTFNPGDHVLFQKSGLWREQLTVPSSGSSNNPITFGAYGSGAAPIINGSTVVPTWTALSSTLVSDVSGASINANVGNASTQTIRVMKYVPLVSTAITSVTVKGKRIGSAPSGNVFSVIYSDSAGTPGSLLAQGANIALSTITTGAGGQLITSAFGTPFNVVAGTTYYFGFSESWGVSATDFLNLFFLNSNPTFPAEFKFTPWTLEANVQLDMTIAQANTNIYTAPATPPGSGESLRVVLFNGAYGYRQDSIASLTAALGWYWANNTAYVYSASAPGTLYISPGIEVATRDYALTVNGKSNVAVTGLATTTANTNDVEIGGGNNISITNTTASAAGYYGIHSVGTDAQNNITLTGVSTDHSGAVGISLNVPAPNTTPNNFIIRSATSFRDGIVAWSFTEAGDANLTYWFPGGIHWFGVVGSSVTNSLITYSGVRDDGLVPNKAIGTKVTGDGIWLDTTRATALGSGNVIAYNNVNNCGGHGLFNEKSQYNTWMYNISYANQTYGIRMDMDTGGGSGNFLIGNAFYNNSTYGNTLGGIFTEGDYLGAAGSVVNNIWKNNLATGSVSGPNFTAQNGAENDGTDGSGNVYTDNGFGPNATNFVNFGNVLYSSYGAWFADWGVYFSMQLDPLFNNPAAGDLTLQTLSPAIGFGATLGAPYDIGLDASSTWPSGVIIKSQTPAWEIGAYVYP